MLEFRQVFVSCEEGKRSIKVLWEIMRADIMVSPEKVWKIDTTWKFARLTHTRHHFASLTNGFCTPLSSTNGREWEWEATVVAIHNKFIELNLIQFYPHKSIESFSWLNFLFFSPARLIIATDSLKPFSSSMIHQIRFNARVCVRLSRAIIVVSYRFSAIE